MGPALSFLLAVLAHGLEAGAVRLQAPGREGAQPPLVEGLNYSSFRAARAENRTDYGHPSWLASCDSIFLDLGTNIGVQIRKLFEPSKYSGAKILSIFDGLFGQPSTRPSRVCALGMEPNPLHQPRLQALEAAYNARGFRTRIYPFAAWTEEGTMTFQSCPRDMNEHESWGAHLGKRRAEEVRTVDITEFILSLPKGSVKLMKMDIEGAEFECMGKAIPMGLMCSDTVGAMVYEGHATTLTGPYWQGSKSAVVIKQQIEAHECSQGSPTLTEAFDDESFLHDVDDDFSR